MIGFIAYVILVAVPCGVIAGTVIFAASRNATVAVGVAAFDVIALAAPPRVAWVYSERAGATTGILVVMAVVLSVLVAVSVTTVLLYAALHPDDAGKHSATDSSSSDRR